MYRGENVEACRELVDEKSGCYKSVPMPWWDALLLIHGYQLCVLWLGTQGVRDGGTLIRV